MFNLIRLAVLFAVAYVHGNEYPDRLCATHEYNEKLLANDKSWAQRLDNFETNWRERQAAIKSGVYNLEGMTSSIITFPIIFHIVSTDPDSITDSAIAYQLDVLNDDFSATNSDYTTGTPVEFQPVRSGDTQIRFSIQSIIRVTSPVPSFSFTDDQIKFSSLGGSNVIDPETNLNFWVGVLSGSLGGYAQFPGGDPATDGIVCAPGTLSPEIGDEPYNLGRTATHEIGHWLNLRHIWGDSLQCKAANNDKQSDFVLDTPVSNFPNFGCPEGIKRCDKKNPYSQDMYMNYMDYVVDSCMVMFTQLQNARAQQSISEFRDGFISDDRRSNHKYINWLYFNRIEEEQEPNDDDNKCVGDDDILFYDNILNRDSDSNVYIYGCMTKTDIMSISHMTDIKLIGDNEECGDEYFRASQDLNEGNQGAVYMCYNKIDSSPDNENLAILDIKFVEKDDILRENIGLYQTYNMNTNGVELNFALKKGTYFQEIGIELNGLENDDDGGDSVDNLTQTNNVYISIGLGILVCILMCILICIFIHKYGSIKKYRDLNASLTKQYGTTTELTNI